MAGRRRAMALAPSCLLSEITVESATWSRTWTTLSTSAPYHRRGVTVTGGRVPMYLTSSRYETMMHDETVGSAS